MSGQTATDSCCQLELLEPHSLRHLSSAAVFYTCELASLPGYCWLWSLFSAEAMLAHNVSLEQEPRKRSRRHNFEIPGEQLSLPFACFLTHAEVYFLHGCNFGIMPRYAQIPLVCLRSPDVCSPGRRRGTSPARHIECQSPVRYAIRLSLQPTTVGL